MSQGEKQIKMAAQMYEMRDRAKLILGDKYKGYMENIGKIIAALAERDNKSVLTVAIDHCNSRNLAGMELLLTIAAAVELVEPSK